MSARSITGALVLLIAMIGAAPASTQAADPVRIVAPAADARLTERTVTVRVRTTARQPRLRVTGYGRGNRLRDMTQRFRRTGPRTFAGRLRVGRELRFGRNHVYAETRAGRGAVASSGFTVYRRARAPMRLRRIELRPNERPPLDIRVRASGTALRARLNGTAAGRSFERVSRGRWRAALTTSDGLRFGPNKLVVTVFRRSARFQRERLAFVVRRDRPIADAGRDRVVRAGTPLRLNARATRAARGRGLALHWRIVRKPRGSRPRLQRARSARPRLVTRVHGRYRIELRAAHRRARAAAAQAAPAAVDTVEVAAGPDLPPAGATIQTIAKQGSSVGIDVTFPPALYGPGQSFFYPMAPGAVIQLLELDRTTLEPQPAVSGAACDAAANSSCFKPGQEQALLTELNGLSSEYIAILSGGGRGPYSAPDAVKQAIERIGGTLDANSPVGVLGELTQGNGGWSVIGIPGLPGGQAYQLIGLRQGPGVPVGSMRGSLRHDSTGVNYAFGWAAEYHTYDTAQPATSHAIAVDGTAFAAAGLPFPGRKATVGFQLAWLDADTLQPRGNFTYEADPNFSYDRSPPYGLGMWGLRDQLRRIAADPKPGLVLLNTIGSVPTLYYNATRNKSDGNDPRGDVAARVTTLLETFGANRYAFILFGSGVPGPGTTGGYSLVGVTGLRHLEGPNAAAELSTRLHRGTSARMAGVLHRSRQGVLRPGSTGAPSAGGDASAVQPDLDQILAQPDQPFAPFRGPAQHAAEEYIAEALDLTAYVGTRYGIREAYWRDEQIDWDGKAETLGNSKELPPCTTSPCAGAFDQVQRTLLKEFQDVQSVRNYFLGGGTSLWGLFQAVYNDANYGLDEVTKKIRDRYNPPPAPTSGPNALGILSGTLGLTGAIGEFVPEVGEEFAAAADVAASVTDIVEASTSEHDGEAKFDPYGYNTTVADLSDDLSGAYDSVEDGLWRLFEILASDRGRLAAAAERVDSEWAIDSDTRAQLQDRLRVNMRQYVWLTMAQPVLATYECALEDVNHVPGRDKSAAMMSTNINFYTWRGPGGGWNLYPTWIVLGRPNRFDWPDTPDASITGPLFADVDSDAQNNLAAVGFRREYFLGARAAATYAKPNDDSERVPLAATTHGLLHQTRRVDSTDDEDRQGLSHRNDWSDYTPSCGKGWFLTTSDPDPSNRNSPYANP